MCWLSEKDLLELDTVSVAGCLGYDVLEQQNAQWARELGFSCWLFRL